MILTCPHFYNNGSYFESQDHTQSIHISSHRGSFLNQEDAISCTLVNFIFDFAPVGIIFRGPVAALSTTTYSHSWQQFRHCFSKRKPLQHSRAEGFSYLLQTACSHWRSMGTLYSYWKYLCNQRSNCGLEVTVNQSVFYTPENLVQVRSIKAVIACQKSESFIAFLYSC